MALPIIPKITGRGDAFEIRQGSNRRDGNATPVIVVDDRGQPIHPVSDSAGLLMFLRKDGTGTHEIIEAANGNWYIAPPADELWAISLIKFHLAASGIDFSKFGGINGGLTNGCLFQVENAAAAVLLDILDGVPLKNNQGFSRHSRSAVATLPGAGPGIIGAEINVLEVIGRPLRLDGSQNMRLVFRTQDDLSSLSSFNIKCTGLRYKTDDVFA